MKKQYVPTQINPARFKKVFFYFVLFCLSIFTLIFIEMFLRIVDYGDNLNLCIDFPEKTEREYRMINPDIGKKYFRQLDYTKPVKTVYLKEKPENGFRIFVLGSSTVVGFPYERNLLFSEILNERLQDCFPDKTIEVINTAITAINSYSLLDYMDEILKEQPDAILIYAGHNEFYGAFGIGSLEGKNRYRELTLLHLDLMHLRLYQFIQDMVNSIIKIIPTKIKEPGIHGTLMKLMAENEDIPYKGEIYNRGVEVFRKNISQMLMLAQQQNVPVFISELISNVRDLEPFCSASTDDYPPAQEIFIKGKKRELNGQYDEAKKCYYQAKDLDCVRFRATEEINEIIRGLAVQYNSNLVPMQKYFEQSSSNELIGNNLLTEHVHPNIKGCFLMADAFFDKLTESKLLGEKVNPVYYKESAYYQANWGYSELDSLLGVHKINALKTHWPFQPYDAPFIDYRKTVKPKSMADSLAIQVFRGEGTDIQKAHMAMGEYYKQKNDFLKASKEYLAAIHCNPYSLTGYLELVECLIHIQDFNLAMKYLNKSLELHETVYAYYNLSEIYFLQDNYKMAFDALKKASKLDKTDQYKEKILLKLYHVYYYIGDRTRLQETLDELRKINPAYQPSIPQKKKYAFYLPVQVEAQVNQALSLYRSRKFEAAKNLFVKSLEIKETALANRCLGDILFSENDSSSIEYYLKAYPDYKNDTDFLKNLCLIYIQKKQLDRAQSVLNEIRTLNPRSKHIALLESYL